MVDRAEVGRVYGDCQISDRVWYLHNKHFVSTVDFTAVVTA